MAKAPTILLMVTSDISVRLLRGSGQYLRNDGWNVHIASSPGPNLAALAAEERVRTHPLPMEREIVPFKDLCALRNVLRLVRAVRPDVVSAGTPKAGLLGMLAARFTRNVRGVYLLRGLRLETTHGWKRGILYVGEWLACRAASIVVPISPSLRDRVVDLRLAPRSKVVLVGKGSSNGVDVAKFTAPPPCPDRYGLRGEPLRRPVLGFVGRLTADKGISTLAGALKLLRQRGMSGTVLVAGPDDSPDAAMLRRQLDASGWEVRHLGMVDDPETLYPMMDILCVPSRREGFGNVILEAAMSNVPSVSSDATGVIDAIIDGKTGLVATPTNEITFSAAIERLISDPPMRTRLGRAARERAIREFAQEVVWSNYSALYRTVANHHGS